MKPIQPNPKILYFDNENDADILIAIENSNCTFLHLRTIDNMDESMENFKPDLILIKDKVITENPTSICNQIKTYDVNPRPIIVFLVKRENTEQKIEILRSGADDVLSYPMIGKEFTHRLIAHIRRRKETHINSLTLLPDIVMASQVLDYCLREVEDWAVLSVDLDNLRIYNDSYGEKRGDQMIKSLAAVLKSVLSEEDFLAHNSSDDFIIITRSSKAETLAEEICRRFDFVAPKFYTGEDVKRGYIIAVGANGIRRRVQLVSISIGITAKNRRKFSSSLEVLQTARDMRYLAKSKRGSDWVSDRLRLGSTSTVETDKKIKILVIEPDASMSLLLRDTLELENYTVETAHTPKEAWEIIEHWIPELILMESDFSSTDFMDGFALTTKIKQEPTLSGIWIIVSTKNPDHTKILESGADLYLPKPFELQILFSEIRYLLRTRIRSKIKL